MLHVILPIAFAGAMPYTLTFLSKSRNFGFKENHHVRVWQAELTGWQQRAYWAHQNSFEAFPLFAIMTILAHMSQPESLVAAYAAWAFVALRIGYAEAYLTDRATLRSVVWTCAMMAVVTELLVALRIV